LKVDIGKGEYLYMDKLLKLDLDFVKGKVLDENNMFLCLVDGRVGTGKSTLVGQCGYYLNTAMTLNNLTFTLEQFERELKKADIGSVIILDESFEVINKRKTQSTANMQILSLLQQMRAKRCFIFIILPSVYDLDKNLILNIADLFIHCYREPFGKRGQFCVYDRTGLKNLWLFCRQNYTYSFKVAKPIYRGRFTKKFPLGFEDYEKRKLTELERARNEVKDKTDNIYIKQRNKLISVLKNNGMNIDNICNSVGLKRSAIYDIIKKIEGK